jgi:hypothetical protein
MIRNGPCTQPLENERLMLFRLNWATTLVHIGNAIGSVVISTHGGRFDLTYRLLHRKEKGELYNFETKSAGITLDLQYLIFSFFALSVGFQLFSQLVVCYKYYERCAPGPDVVASKRESLPSENRHLVVNSAKPPVYAELPLAHWLRFVEYSFSASIMLIAIALLNGIDDVRELVCIFTLCVATQLFGLLSEREPLEGPNSSQRWVAHFSGWLTFLAAYGVIMSHYLVDKGSVRDIPWWVDVIVYSTAFMFSVFGFVQLVRSCCPKTVSAFHAECAYLILSMASKTLLGWLVLGAALRRK